MPREKQRSGWPSQERPATRDPRQRGSRHFIRFRTNLRDSESPGPLGVFWAAGHCLDSGVLDSRSHKRLGEICEWFNINLVVPELDPEHWRAVFWFRSDCNGLLGRIWEMAYLMQDGGVTVELIHTVDPGSICYKDKHQIAAIPRRGRKRPKRSHYFSALLV
jgi:hypothetical protein